MEDRYIRVATTLYKIVRKPLLSGDFIEMRVVWNYETFRRDHSADIKPLIEKYDGFCCVPSHTNVVIIRITATKSYCDSMGKTYSPTNAVPSARLSFTSLFGMGRGYHHRLITLFQKVF